MNYAKIKHWDIANGEGVRISLFVSGCNFHCKDCFNKEAWDFTYGDTFTQETYNEIIRLLSDKNIDGLSLLGGDPLCQDDDGLQTLISLCREVHKLGKNVWLWSGYTWEEIFSNNDMTQNARLKQELIRECDMFIDGRFKIEQKNLNLVWRGSANQRVIDVKRSLDENKVIKYI